MAATPAMAFFNYSNMQMTAKIVYYGPGLCGKTTNLQYIYAHTVDNSRGEMVSLETQTDRTLFFDLLPMEVGTVAGFKTRVQLYTVPGQVFYNTTRKLVLKGVDGIVFVADAQRPMLQSNGDSLKNLGGNLQTIGVSLDQIPLVLQYNKRDLQDVCTVAELNQVMNSAGEIPCFEASALTGQGVFETLRGITTLTLLGLKKELEATAAEAPPEKSASERPPVAAPAVTAPQQPAAGNDGSASSRELLVSLQQSDFRRAQRLLVSVQVQDDRREIMHEVRNLQWDLSDAASVDELKVRLNIAVNGKG